MFGDWKQNKKDIFRADLIKERWVKQYLRRHRLSALAFTAFDAYPQQKLKVFASAKTVISAQICLTSQRIEIWLVLEAAVALAAAGLVTHELWKRHLLQRVLTRWIRLTSTPSRRCKLFLLVQYPANATIFWILHKEQQKQVSMDDWRFTKQNVSFLKMRILLWRKCKIAALKQFTSWKQP